MTCRDPREYFRIFDDAHFKTADGKVIGFELVGCMCIETYVKVKRNQNQICWKWRKVIALFVTSVCSLSVILPFLE